MLFHELVLNHLVKQLIILQRSSLDKVSARVGTKSGEGSPNLTYVHTHRFSLPSARARKLQQARTKPAAPGAAPESKTDISLEHSHTGHFCVVCSGLLTTSELSNQWPAKPKTPYGFLQKKLSDPCSAGSPFPRTFLLALGATVSSRVLWSLGHTVHQVYPFTSALI